MTVTVQCPNPSCRKTAEVNEDNLARPVYCTYCGHAVTVSPSVGDLELAAGPLAPIGAKETIVSSVIVDAHVSDTQAGAIKPGQQVAEMGIPQQIGRFQIRSRLGRGAFGAVYRAYDPQLDREVALKVPHPGTLESSKATERFLREAKLAAKLRHAHIVPIYEAGFDGSHYYIASPFIEGRTLAHALEEGEFDFRESARIVCDLAEALAYAHALGIIHRDVKPANIMLDERGEAQLMDFGLAYRQDVATRLTQDGALLGTPSYMAPEQAIGQTADPLPASDQYSLGVVLYELLCGRVPFGGPSHVVLFNVVYQQPPAPHSMKPRVPRDLEAICLKAIRKRPEKRYASCEQLAHHLRGWLDLKPGNRHSLGAEQEVVPGHLRLRVLFITGVFVAVCLVALAAFAAIRAVKSNEMVSANHEGAPPLVAPINESEKTAQSKASDAKAETESKVTAQPEPKATMETTEAKPAKPVEKPPTLARVQPPRTERRELGKFILLLPSILLQQSQEKGIWQRIKPESPIYSTDYLVSLPGYRSELRLDSGVKLVLWGNLPEFSRIPVLESAGTLHVNPAFQADFTLDHGRVVLSNMRKEGPVRIRLRFADEVWDLTLADQTAEVSVELGGVCVPYTRGTAGGDPEISLALLTLKGEVQLKRRYEEFLLSSPSLLAWDNIAGMGRESRKLNGPPEWWTSKLPPKTPMQSALEGLTKRLIAKDSVDVAVAELMKDSDPPSRILALRCLGAMGELSKLLDALNDDRHPDVAVIGRQELLHFLGLSPKNDEKLVKVLKQKNYSEGQAQTVMQLLHGFSREQLANKATRNALADYLTHEKLAIRHLSYMLLLALAPEGQSITYKPAGDIGQRERGAGEWRKFLLNGKPPADDTLESEEKRAANKLKLAETLAKAGKLEKAKERCQEILASFSKTKAAVEAKKLLEQLDK